MASGDAFTVVAICQLAFISLPDRIPPLKTNIG
jgi:hypothetical protein